MKSLSASIITLAGAAWYIAAHFAPPEIGFVTMADCVRYFGLVLSAVGAITWFISWCRRPEMTA
jgi:hypothetical protein